MPVYDYECDRCGPFTAMRPMAESDLSLGCPSCNAAAPRAFLTAPRLASMNPQRRDAFARNEQSAHAPRALSQTSGSHAAGCSCCSGASGRFVNRGKDGSKSFPSSRPWMISH